MAKPILIIKTDNSLNSQVARDNEDSLESRLDNEYFVLILPITNGELEIEVLNVDTKSELDIDKLKDEIKEMLDANNRHRQAD